MRLLWTLTPRVIMGFSAWMTLALFVAIKNEVQGCDAPTLCRVNEGFAADYFRGLVPVAAVLATVANLPTEVSSAPGKRRF